MTEHRTEILNALASAARLCAETDERWVRVTEELLNRLMEELRASIPLSRVRELCREFDESEGWYPEHQFEGASVWKFIRWTIQGGQKPDSFDMWGCANDPAKAWAQIDAEEQPGDAERTEKEPQ